MRWIIVDLLIAHLVASYGMVLSFAIVERRPKAEVWLLAPFVSPMALREVVLDPSPKDFARPRAARVAVVGSYLSCFTGTIVSRRLLGRGSLHSRRRRKGLCTECGYDLTGNVSGKCPECGVHVNPKARLLVRRNG
jgi:hypothetical protein